MNEHLSDLARAASVRGETRFSDFLELPEQKEAQYAAGHFHEECLLWGGFDAAERKIACFLPAMDDSEPVWPFVRVRAEWNTKFADCGHRDILGALMALGIAREKTGDICVGEGYAILFVKEDIAPYILTSLESAGHAELKLSVDESGDPVPLPKGIVTRVTVQSMRLDALVAACCDVSRANAQELIRRGLVKHNHVEQPRTDCAVSAGDILSVKGRGRWRIEEEQGETRRGRLGVLIFRFGD